MTLALMTENDLEMVLEWRNKPTVRMGMYNNQIITLEAHKKWFYGLQGDLSSAWYVYRNSMDKPEGVVYFTQRQQKNNSAFWGLYSGDNASYGAGLRMEYEALNLAFNDMKLHKLNCEVISTNHLVVKLHRKFGFIEEGNFRDFHFDGNNYVNVIRLGILKSEWQSICEQIKARIRY